MTKPSYHERIKEEKRARLVEAGIELFLEQGYDRTSLAQVAAAAGISTATLFKRFPTKAALFAAIVDECWQVDVEYAAPPQAGEPRAGLTKIGRDYACLLTRPRMAEVLRVVIAELPRFPELSQAEFAVQGDPFLAGLKDYLADEVARGTLDVPDIDAVARQFLCIISARILWPRLLLADYDRAAIGDDPTVDDAVDFMLTRYASAPGKATAPKRPSTQTAPQS